LKRISKRFSADEKSQQQQRKQQQQQRDANEQSDGPRPPPLYVEPSHFTEPLVLNEGAMVSIQSWNIQGFSKRYHENYPKEDILFRILEPPQHGQLLKHGQSVSQFVSSDILSNKIYYKHDDSETTVDFIRLEVL
uniref:LTD domain-containing protein n=1 Tax=Onchocerca flexuosa TaxID=387005 RepID=A0A183HUU7_9BILA